MRTTHTLPANQRPLAERIAADVAGELGIRVPRVEWCRHARYDGPADFEDWSALRGGGCDDGHCVWISSGQEADALVEAVAHAVKHLADPRSGAEGEASARRGRWERAAIRLATNRVGGSASQRLRGHHRPEALV